MKMGTDIQECPHVQGVAFWRCYGVVWPDVLTSNGDPYMVRSHVKHRHPEKIPAFDAWVSEVMGCPPDWATSNEVQK